MKYEALANYAKQNAIKNYRKLPWMDLYWRTVAGESEVLISNRLIDKMTEFDITGTIIDSETLITPQGLPA